MFVLTLIRIPIIFEIPFEIESFAIKREQQCISPQSLRSLDGIAWLSSEGIDLSFPLLSPLAPVTSPFPLPLSLLSLYLFPISSREGQTCAVYKRHSLYRRSVENFCLFAFPPFFSSFQILSREIRLNGINSFLCHTFPF